MIRNPDGTSWCPTGSLNQFDPESPDKCLWNSLDAELIQMSGTPILYYEVLIQMQTVDKLYLEDRGKLWSPIPVQLWAIYEVQPSQNLQTMFGIDAQDEVSMELNFQDVKARLGHMPKVGSRIYTPHKKENWVVVQRNDGEYKAWGQIRLQLICRKFQESLTTGEGKVTQTEIAPNYKIN